MQSKVIRLNMAWSVDFARALLAQRALLIPGRQRVAIASLVSPLRYDILVREQYLEFCSTNTELAANDFQQFLQRSLQHPYFEWFRLIFAPRQLKSLRGDSRALQIAFERRVKSVLALRESFRTQGFDRSRPIVLRTALRLRPSTSGKRVAVRYFAGDGCHRLALLRRAGITHLDAKDHRILFSPVLRPLDNTKTLLPAINPPEADYAEFLSMSYASVPHTTLPELRADVETRNPGRLEELDRVLAIDARARDAYNPPSPQ
jgi:hypothetical protein